MRVLEAITPSQIGGAEVFVAGLCRALPDLGVDVELFCPAGRPFVDYAAERGIRSVGWHTHGKCDPVTVLRLVCLIKRFRADIIHTHLSTASLLGAFAARLAGSVSVAHAHGLNTATCFKYSTAVIAVSEAVKEHLCAQGLESSRIHVVHNGVDLRWFQPMEIAEARRGLGFDTERPMFGLFGRLSPEKGQRVAIEAVAFVARRHAGVQLLLVGDGRDRPGLELLADRLGIADRVKFTGFVSDVRRFVSACDAVIVSSLREGFGMSAVEAMALERPVVACSVGGLKEIVVHGETGFRVDSCNSSAMGRYLEELIEDKGLRDRLGKRGRERVAECFERGKQNRRLLDVFSKLA